MRRQRKTPGSIGQPGPQKAQRTTKGADWRREEVLSRQKRHFNPDRLTLHILPGEAKDKDKGRTFPVGVIPELRDAILGQMAVTEALEKKQGR
ncbi:MAG: hypothetical protein AB1405_02090, partial [Bdellovibrionota bacterium]